jgi:hypothetical protein
MSDETRRADAPEVRETLMNADGTRREATQPSGRSRRNTVVGLRAGLLAALVPALFLAAVPSTARASEKMAVLVLGTSEKDTELADNVTEMIIAAIAQRGGFEVAGKEEFKARLDVQSERKAQACLDDNNCLARTGVSLGVRRLVTGNVGARSNRQYLFSLALLNIETGKTDNRVFRLIEGSQADLIAAVKAGTEELFRPKVEPGRIQVSSEPTGARVSIDNAYLGITPLISGTLLPGPHHVRVEAENAFPWSSNVEVVSGQDLGIKLTEDNLQKRRSWPTKAVAITGGLAAASFASAAFLGVLSGLNPTGDTRAAAQSDLNEKKNLARDANIALIAGGAFSVATVALLIGYASDIFGRHDDDDAN